MVQTVLKIEHARPTLWIGCVRYRSHHQVYVTYPFAMLLNDRFQVLQVICSGAAAASHDMMGALLAAKWHFAGQLQNHRL